ncbi:Crp/Fnr family transcriptional regulator [Listeria ilorinensis]|uniref:Crp/Fnr family transcriptional regulator n=1 Tax=Listeria ilorinensis TaxID=2867439 RepID=UPI001EF6B759|nr:cyclic nucleotide-binding domain-containing protein [Listeria ilorinensis]
MKKIFGYKNLISLLEKEGFISNETFPKNTILDMNDTDYVYIIREGLVTSKLFSEKENVYSFHSKGDFLGFLNIYDQIVKQMTFLTESRCKFYRIKNEDLRFFLSFPENVPFTFYIMRNLEEHFYLNSLIFQQQINYRTAQAFLNITMLLRDRDKTEEYLLLPNTYYIKKIKLYTQLSSDSFYKQLNLLKELKIIEKKQNGLLINSKKLYEFTPKLLKKENWV